ncbi:MAG: polysaccharide pyruvyl transferase family protein [Candidatus Electrothrix sp. AW2]|nr:polysaccharide pyruvyl transferase family protein [Candidatus Electrothrix gigas]
MAPQKKYSFSLFGAALDTNNLGVSALCYSTVQQLKRLDNKIEITVFDHGRGRRDKSIKLPDGDIQLSLQGAVNSRRYYRPENLWVMRVAGLLGGLGNSGIATIKKSDAVLDISGGDSFSDIYGKKRFYHVTSPKLIALQQKKPLILMPQTYGPFASDKYRNIAADIVKQATVAWARDERSYTVLKELAGDEFDPKRHQCGVDVAFGLPAIKPKNLPVKLSELLHVDNQTVGINISGLIYNNQKNARSQFNLIADYNSVVNKLVTRFLESTDCKILFIPHVVSPDHGEESDIRACNDVLKRIPENLRNRVHTAPGYTSPCEIKWVISRLYWFCGTRMHATIAALSSGVPTSAISYSPKTLGVFETCGQGEHVADPTSLNTDEVVDHLWASWEKRNKALEQLNEFLPKVTEQLDNQMRSVMDVIRR